MFGAASLLERLVWAPWVLVGARLLQGIGGAATATLGFTFLIYAVSEGPKNGWASLATPGTAGLGAVLLGLFVAAERRWCRSRSCVGAPLPS